MASTTINGLCDSIIAAAQNIFTRGCDGVAQNNMAKLMEICNLANEIKSTVNKEGD